MGGCWAFTILTTKNSCKPTIVLVLILLGILTCVPFAECEETEESYVLRMDMAIYINNLFFENDTANIDVNLWIRNFPIDASIVYVQFQSLEHYEVNCNRIGGGAPNRYQFQGKLEEKSWYLDGIGELFPFDYYVLEFMLYPYSIQYEINGTICGMRYLNYTFVEEQTHVDFAGLFRPRLKDQWEILRYSTNTTYYVYLFRKGEMPSLQFLVPMFLIQLLVVLVPSFTNDKSIRIRLFSSLLLFAPMFIFTIQNFLPYRSTLSIPEFLGLTLIFSCTLMLLSSLLGDPKHKTRTFAFDVGALVVSYVLYAWLMILVYEKKMSFLRLPHVKPAFDLVSIIFLIGAVYKVISIYKMTFWNNLRSAIHTLRQKTKGAQNHR